MKAYRICCLIFFSRSTMDKENFILGCIVTFAAVCITTLERKQLIKIGKKLKVSFLNCYRTASKEMPTDLKLKKWYYRGEGNSYLSLSIPETRQILRIKKIFYPVGIKENILYYLSKHSRLGNINEAKARIEEKNNLQFYHTFRSLLGEPYVQPAKEAVLDRKEIEEIDAIIAPLRPKNRKKKHLAYACGSLLADYAYFPISWDVDDIHPTYSVEIKPKAGWITPNERKYPKCTYCLNQYIKLQNNDITEISKYCPMDLFSGDPNRLKYSIKCLFETPQNNLQIFKDGQLIYGENRKNHEVLCDIFEDKFETSLESFCHFITKSLLTNLLVENQCPNLKSEQEMENFPKKSDIKGCEFSGNNLPRGCVLERIVNIQKLDQWGSEEIYSNLQNNNMNLNDSVSIPLCKLNHQIDLHSVVRQYLIAAVARDLSLMITFKRILTTSNLNVPQENVIKTENGRQYAIQIGVFDLYPKTMQSITKHVRKRQMIAKVYEELMEKRL